MFFNSFEMLTFLLGGGTLFLLEINSDGSFREVSTFQWTDGLFDVVWSEVDPNTVVSASGDGGLQLWNLNSPQVKSI